MLLRREKDSTPPLLTTLNFILGARRTFSKLFSTSGISQSSGGSTQRVSDFQCTEGHYSEIGFVNPIYHTRGRATS